ncbi:PP2C family serine/threonine-protein phosphatase [Nonomuraea wenchangensis]|uniref:PP2C family serine/threonine-protein phosphatase n=1 Tax=Nonomuraea wenchangensis TaxID=568860 RepID=UPI003409C619
MAVTAPEARAADAGAGACPVCGTPVYEGYAYCEKCGHTLGSPTCTSCGAAAVDSEGYCERCGLRQPTGRDHAEIVLEGGAAAVTDRGLRRSRNEDAVALLAAGRSTVAVVCDGVGSSPRADEASAVAVEAASAALIRGLSHEEAFELAGRAVTKLATSVHDAPASTYVAAVVRDGRISLAWAGDTRAYWLPAGPLDGPPTRPVGRLADGPVGGPADGPPSGLTDGPPSGLTDGPPSGLTDGPPSGLADGPPSGLATGPLDARPDVPPGGFMLTTDDAIETGEITAWLGADAGDVRPHVRVFEPQGPGLLLVCSDGLWRYLDGHPLPAPGEPQALARELLRHALDSGGQDNITIALIPLGELP